MGRFAGRSALVTGASRGLGRAIAEAFAREGARVGIGYRARREEAERTLAQIERSGGRGALLAFDVRDPVAIAAAVEEFTRDSDLDILVNNAAVVRDQHIAFMSSEDWEHVVSVNLNGTYHCCRAVVPRMMARRRGAIVNVASTAALRASPGQSNYSGSKGGVVAFTATLAAEVASYGVRVNAVAPGLLSTGMGTRFDRRTIERRSAAIPLARLGTAEEIANVVLFLASDESSYVVGQCFRVDGGLSL
ncbi:MAG TPA: SDR family NAD(P)-dependent oxidoreductase [Acidobacteriota bacterium]|nr:SDR family NAD(P)-dependent oxidoreductase [Acidobacteriota bacterium]